MAEYSTPGVYIKELNAFPNSIVAVPTSIPVFIGYTEFATDLSENKLDGIPTPISSLSEFIILFGKGFKTKFIVTTNLHAAAPAATPDIIADALNQPISELTINSIKYNVEVVHPTRA